MGLTLLDRVDELAGVIDAKVVAADIMFGQSHRPLFGRTLAGEDTFAPPFII